MPAGPFGSCAVSDVVDGSCRDSVGRRVVAYHERVPVVAHVIFPHGSNRGVGF